MNLLHPTHTRGDDSDNEGDDGSNVTIMPPRESPGRPADIIILLTPTHGNVGIIIYDAWIHPDMSIIFSGP